VDELLTPKLGHIDAVAIAAFWHSLMGMDARGRPVTPLLSWSDRRAGRKRSTCRPPSTSATSTAAPAAGCT
jgi:sugar (pentulose or hexulose) kinase